ncbi:hypothetical protein KR200_008919 [Drosophila serrata]|nr:hypothetical protein KR200_008919 [Drosophila serrata]
MRCGTLLIILLVNILLANITEMTQQDLVGFFFKGKPKCIQVAPKEITGATSPKEVVGSKVKSILSSQGYLASMTADAILVGKKQVLDQLLENLAETRGAMEEVQRAIVTSSTFMKTVGRVRNKTRDRLTNLQGIYKEEMDTMRGMVANARQLVKEKLSLVEASKFRVEELHTLMKEARAALDRNWDMSKKANYSAAEARKHIGTMPPKAD